MKCIYCKRDGLEVLGSVPKGREKYRNQTYLFCPSCKNNMLIMNDDLKSEIEPPFDFKDISEAKSSSERLFMKEEFAKWNKKQRALDKKRERLRKDEL